MTSAKNSRAHIHTIVTHSKPHAEELIGIALLKEFGESEFPGISDAKVEYLKGHQHPTGKSAAELVASGIIPVGVCGGEFDEHPFDGRLAKNEDCAATLIAKRLNITDPVILRVVDYAYRTEKRSGWSQFQFSSLVKAMNEANASKPDDVVSWAQFAIHALLHDTRKVAECNEDFVDDFVATVLLQTFSSEPTLPKMTSRLPSDSRTRAAVRALELENDPRLEGLVKQVEGSAGQGRNRFEFATLLSTIRHAYPEDSYGVALWGQRAIGALIYASQGAHEAKRSVSEMIPRILKTQHCGPINALFIETDRVHFSRVVFNTTAERMSGENSEGDCGLVHLLVQRTSSRNVQIFCNKRFRFKIHGVAAALRLMECEKAGSPIANPDYDHFMKGGMIAECDKWFYFEAEGAEMLLNGSTTRPDISPTILSFEEIQDAIEKNLVFMDE